MLLRKIVGTKNCPSEEGRAGKEIVLLTKWTVIRIVAMEKNCVKLTGTGNWRGMESNMAQDEGEFFISVTFERKKKAKKKCKI